MPEKKKKKKEIMLHQWDDCETHEDFDWDDFLECLDNTLEQTLNPSCYWYCEGEDLGWRKLSGHKYFEASCASEIFKSILPKTSCSLRIFKGTRRFPIKVQCFHHDSPTGEWYYLKKISERTWNAKREHV